MRKYLPSQVPEVFNKFTAFDNNTIGLKKNAVKIVHSLKSTNLVKMKYINHLIFKFHRMLLLHMKGHQKGGRSSVTTPWPMCQRRRRTMFGFEEDSYKSGHPGSPRPCPLLIGTTWIENPTSKSTSAPPLLLSYKAMLQISWSSWGEAFHQKEPLI